MALLRVSKVDIKGIAVSVPKEVRDYSHVSHLFSKQEYNQFVKATGVEFARKANSTHTTSDYCFAAAERLLSDLNTAKNEIDLLVFVSQSPDYIIPMTSCILQERLGLPKSIIAFDIISGCSGYIQGLSVVSSMIQGGAIRSALLLVGDANQEQISKCDKTTSPLFGAAGSASLLCYDPQASDMFFELGTDGSGADAIMIRDGGCRHPFSAESLVEHKIAEGVVRKNTQLTLKGEDVFSFAISEVPDSIERLYGYYGLDLAKTDHFVFHQANKMILDTIADILDIPLAKVPMSLRDFGNTSSASISLTIATQIGTISQPTTLCLIGFGVGLSWGSVHLQTDSLFCSPLVEL